MPSCPWRFQSTVQHQQWQRQPQSRSDCVATPTASSLLIVRGFVVCWMSASYSSLLCVLVQIERGCSHSMLFDVASGVGFCILVSPRRLPEICQSWNCVAWLRSIFFCLAWHFGEHFWFCCHTVIQKTVAACACVWRGADRRRQFVIFLAIFVFNTHIHGMYIFLFNFFLLLWNFVRRGNSTLLWAWWMMSAWRWGAR